MNVLKISFISIAVIFIFLFSCKKGTPDTIIYKVSLHRCVFASFTPVQICLDSVIEDSRCPINALCITAGQAAVAFSLHENNHVYPFTLSLTAGRSSDTIVQGHFIKFIDLYPYPLDGGTYDTYASLNIN